MIPEHEAATLAMSVTEALDLAEAGQVLDGYRCLLGGLARAEEAAAEEEPWGPELVTRYRIALTNYGERFGIRPE